MRILALAFLLSAPVLAMPETVLMLGLVDKGLGDATETLSSFVVSEASKYPEISLTAGDDLRQMMAVDAEQEALGCSDDSSCISELALALDSRFIIFGNASRLGELVIINITLLDAKTNAPLSRETIESTDMKALPGLLRVGVRRLLAPMSDTAKAQLEEAATPTEIGPTPAAGESAGATPWIIVGAGAVAIAVGGLIATPGVWAPMEIDRLEKDGSRLAFDDAKRLQDDFYGTPPLAYLALGAGALLTTIGLGAIGGGLFWGMQ